MDPADLERTLAMVMAPSSEGIMAASERLKNHFYEYSETVPALVQIMQHHQDHTMRQLAGVEVRKLISRYWRAPEVEPVKQLPEPVMAQIKATLLESTLREQHELVRHTSARVLSAIAAIDLDDGRWPELIPALLSAATTSEDPQQREVAIYIIYALSDSDYAEAVGNNPKQLLELLSQTIKDSDRRVRVTSVLALCSVGASLSGKDSKLFQQFVPAIVEVLSEAVQSDDEKNALQVFERLGELVMGDPALLGDTFGELIGHMMSQYGSNTGVSTEYRLAALRVINCACLFRYAKLKSMHAGPELVKALVQIVVTDDEDDDGEDDDEDEDESQETTVGRLALRSIGALALYLPPKQSIHPLLDLLPSLVHSGDPKQLRAGYLAFSVSVSGAPEFVASETNTIIPWIVSGFNNANLSVQVAALQALCMMAMELPSAVGEHHAVLLPLVFNLMDQAQTVKVARTACRALDTVLSSLSKEVITEQYLSVLVPKLLDLVDKAPDTQLKGSVVNAIGSAAFAAGKNFIPYFERSVQTIQKFIILPPPSDNLPIVKLCGETLEALGTFCLAVGDEQFAPYLPACLEAALTFLTGDDSQIKDIGPIFIGNAAAVFGDHLEPYMTRIMPALFQVFQQQEFEGFPESLEEEETGSTFAEAAPVAVGTNDDEEDTGFHVNSAVAIEKEFSCDCLAELWSHCSANIMAPWTAETLDKLGDLCLHFYEDIRRSAVIAAWNLAITLRTGEAVEAVWTLTEELLDSEDDISVMQEICQSISRALDKIGRNVLGTNENLETLFRMLFEVISKTHRSMRDLDDFDDLDVAAAEADKSTEEEEITEAAQGLITAAVDLLIDIARVMKEDFLPVFPQCATTLKPYTMSKVDTERSTGVYAFAELLSILGAGIAEHSSEFLVLFGQALADSNPEVRSMAAYGLGFVCLGSTSPDVPAAYPEIFLKLQQGILAANIEGIDGRAVANALGCIARMGLAHPDKVPLDDVVPVFISKLPLSDGLEEYPPIIEFLLKVAEHRHQSISGAAGEQLLVIMHSLIEEQSKVDALNKDISFSEEPKPAPLSDAATAENARNIIALLSSK